MAGSLCPICAVGNANTKEDIAPQWLRRELRSVDAYADAANYPSFVVRICDDCNRSFGKRYENEAADIIKPMLHGDHRSISPSAQLVIVRWVIKTTLFGGIAYLPSFPIALQEHIQCMCREMKVKDILPHQSLVRIGYCNPTVTTDPVNPALHNIGELPEVLYHSVTMLGTLAWEVAIASPEFLEAFAKACPDSDALLKIWPPRHEDIQWPPPKRLTMQDIYYLRLAWREKSWPIPGNATPQPSAAWRSVKVRRSEN